jgi:predicted nuclease of restriction endonuclease-like (RecB) superfamily
MSQPKDPLPKLTNLSEPTNIGASELTSLPAQPAGYGDFLREIKTQIRQRQYRALRAANSELLALYWWLGENISQRQVAQGWGKSVVENLARDLQAEFPGRNGFSTQNLWAMRQLFNEYSQNPKLQPLVREISWAKSLVIMTRCKDDLEREFYLRATTTWPACDSGCVSRHPFKREIHDEISLYLTYSLRKQLSK